MLRTFILSLFSFSLLVSCQQADKNLDFDDSRNPYYKKAETHLQALNYPEADKDYDDALAANPKLVNAHYELGRIYSDKLGDQISAMYHYQKYLEMNPTADNHDKVQALLDNEKISFAATLPNSPVQNAQAFAQLQSENMQLKKTLAQKGVNPTDASNGAEPVNATATSPSSDNSAPATATPVNSAPSPSTPSTDNSGMNNGSPDTSAVSSSTTASPQDTTANNAGARSYTIKSGDTLWKVSSQFYHGQTAKGIEKIKQANASLLQDNKPLKIGMVLVIP